MENNSKKTEAHKYTKERFYTVLCNHTTVHTLNNREIGSAEKKSEEAIFVLLFSEHVCN